MARTAHNYRRPHQKKSGIGPGDKLAYNSVLAIFLSCSFSFKDRFANWINMPWAFHDSLFEKTRLRVTVWHLRFLL